MIQLTEKNKELLHRVLKYGMTGCYYPPDRIRVEGIDRFFDKQEDQISEKDAEIIAHYHDLYLSDLLEIINDEEECDEWLKVRSYPFEDPW